MINKQQNMFELNNLMQQQQQQPVNNNNNNVNLLSGIDVSTTKNSFSRSKSVSTSVNGNTKEIMNDQMFGSIAIPSKKDAYNVSIAMIEYES